MNTMESLLECEICLVRCDNDDRKPRVLPCGHTVCGQCISGSIKANDGKLDCPFCRVPCGQGPLEAEDFPINITIVKMLEAENQKASANNSPQHQPTESFEQIRQEEVNITACHVLSCASLMSRLKVHKQNLQSHQLIQAQMKTELLEALTRHQKQIDEMGTRIETELQSVEVVLSSGRTLMKNLEESEDRLKNANNANEVRSTSLEIQHFSATIKEWGNTNANSLLESNTLSLSTQLTSRTYKGITGLNGSTRFVDTLASPALELIPLLPQTFTEISLQELLEVMRAARQPGGRAVYGVETVDNETRSARIVLEGEDLFIYQQQTNLDTSNAVTVPYQTLSDLLKKSGERSFLELSWDGFTQGRVIIKPLAECNRYKQFTMMCAGQHGPSYARTPLRKEQYGGDYLRCVSICGGNYDNSGGKALLNNLEFGGVCEHMHQNGLVVGTSHRSKDSTQFEIYVDYSGSMFQTHDCAFGIVEAGLTFLRELPKGSSSAQVSKCGMVITIDSSLFQLLRPTRTNSV